MDGCRYACCYYHLMSLFQLIKRNLAKYNPDIAQEEEEESAVVLQSADSSKKVKGRRKMEGKEDTGWDTDLDIEGKLISLP